MKTTQSQAFAVIMGATGGIGSQIARQLSSQGWGLLLVARNEHRLESLANELDHCEYIAADLTQPNEVAQVFEKFQKISATEHVALAHCIGSIVLKPAHLISDQAWHECLNLNLNSAFYVLREFTKNRRQGSSSMLFFSSAAAIVGLKNHEAIAAAKAGLIGLCRSAASTYATKNIRVNVIAPGLVETPLSHFLLEKEASRKISEQMHPLGRVGIPQDITPLAAWLMSEESQWTTGQVFSVDGGLSTLR
jgi:NAD(P)-dependent dehydrogenase (short-subunit alcohol dehydrogenase family)